MENVKKTKDNIIPVFPMLEEEKEINEIVKQLHLPKGTVESCVLVRNYIRYGRDFTSKFPFAVCQAAESYYKDRKDDIAALYARNLNKKNTATDDTAKPKQITDATVETDKPNESNYPEDLVTMCELHHEQIDVPEAKIGIIPDLADLRYLRGFINHILKYQPREEE